MHVRKIILKHTTTTKQSTKFCIYLSGSSNPNVKTQVRYTLLWMRNARQILSFYEVYGETFVLAEFTTCTLSVTILTYQAEVGPVPLDASSTSIISLARRLSETHLSKPLLPRWFCVEAAAAASAYQTVEAILDNSLRQIKSDPGIKANPSIVNLVTQPTVAVKMLARWPFISHHTLVIIWPLLEVPAA